jgi:hypothetical protein
MGKSEEYKKKAREYYKKAKKETKKYAKKIWKKGKSLIETQEGMFANLGSMTEAERKRKKELDKIMKQS